MTQNELSPQLKDQISRLQEMRAQLQMLMQQRQQIEMRLNEVTEAITELDKVDDKMQVYKSIGALLIQTKGKTEVLKDLKENKESLDLRKATLDKQEGRIKEKLNELQSKVQNSLNISGNPEEG